MHIIEHPIVPLSTPIFNGFPHGGKIEIHADCWPGPNNGFVIEFMSKHGIALHLNARMGSCGENILVLNSFKNGRWECEERHCNPFHGHFHLKIKNKHGHYSIDVNHRHVCNFHHRETSHHIHTMSVRGDIRVQKIHFEGFHHHNGGGVQVGGGAYPMAAPIMYSQPAPMVVAAPPPVVMAAPPVVVVEEGHHHHHHHRHHHGLLHNLFHHHHHHC